MKKFTNNLFLNAFSNFSLVMVLQILLLPYFNNSLQTKEFGEFVLYLAIINGVSISISSVFSNLYLKYYSKYTDENVEDYSFIIYLKYIFFISLSVIIISTVIAFILISLEIFLISLIIFITSYRIFLPTFFRVRLNYKPIFMLNVSIAIFYIILLFFNINSVLQILYYFLLIESIICILLFVMMKKQLRISKKELETFGFREFIWLWISSISINLINYLDRVLVTSLVGISALPIYFAGLIVVRIFSQPLNVLSNVIFSHVSNVKDLNSKKLNITLIIGPSLTVLSIILVSVIGPYIIHWLYDEYYEETMRIFFLINIAFSLSIMDYIYRGILIKFYDVKIKSKIDIISLFLFIIVSILLVNAGLYIEGIVIAKLISEVVRSIFQFSLIYKLKNKTSYS